MSKRNSYLALLVVAGLSANPVSALADDGNYSVVNRAFDFFTDSGNGWNMFANDDAHIGPGGGGQGFDAEYLFYKYDESTNNLSIGLQTGFDVNDGMYLYGPRNNKKNYYAGDLSLSFDGSTSGALNGYEYAVDFGLLTKDYDGSFVNDGTNNIGVDTAGLYAVSEWNNNIYYSDSSPFAMDEGVFVKSLSQNDAGSGFSDGVNNSGRDKSYYRIVTFNLQNIVDTSNSFTVDAQWTMSCGNDAINGNFNIAQSGGGTPVPEPSILALFGIGTLGIAVSGIRRRNLKL